MTNTTPAPAPANTPAPAPAPNALCGCGCGVRCVTARARFLSGHDARFAGALGRGEVAQPLTAFQAALLTPALQAKVDAVSATARRRAADKAAKAAAQAAAKAAYAAALAAA